MDPKKEKEINRLMSLVGESNPRFVSLSVLYRSRKDMNKMFDEQIKSETSLLKYEILNFFCNRIHENSVEDLKKVTGIYFVDHNVAQYELLRFVLESVFIVGIDTDNQIFVQAGGAFTPPIKMEDIKRREIAKSFEEVQELLDRISGYLKGIAKFDFTPIDNSTEEFRISFSIAGLIHEGSKSVE